MDRGLEPALAPGRGNALGVERLGDVEDALAAERHLEDSSGDGVCGRIQGQFGSLLAAVLDLNALVTVWGVVRDPEAASGGLAHSAPDFLGEVLGVELVHALDDRLHQLARRRVVGVLGDRGDADPAPAQHRLECDRVLALAREAGELPDQDLLEGRIGLGGFVEHLAELGSIGDAT